MEKAKYILYRKADSDDIESLAELRLAMLCEDKDLANSIKAEIYENTKKYIEQSFKDGSFVAWVAVNTKNKILATSGLTFYSIPPNMWCPNGRTAYISNMYTLPEFRRQGIAKHLFALNLEEAKKNDCRRILLHTTDMGKPLYEKFGFEMSDSAMAYFPFRKKDNL